MLKYLLPQTICITLVKIYEKYRTYKLIVKTKCSFIPISVCLKIQTYKEIASSNTLYLKETILKFTVF